MVEDADKEFLPSEERESPPEPEPEVQLPHSQMSSDVISDTILEEPEDEEEEEEPIRPPPKVPPPPLPSSTSEPPKQDPNAFEANFEAAFEANFDNAFGGPDSEVPKMLVGGRASIPDELEPQQLARLQNLKESNA